MSVIGAEQVMRVDDNDGNFSVADKMVIFLGASQI